MSPAAQRLLAPSKWKAWEYALWALIFAVPVVFAGLRVATVSNSASGVAKWR